MNRYLKLLKNFFLMVIGQFSSKLLSFLLVPLYTYILSTEEYGSFELITTTVTLLTPLLTLVIAEGVMRFCLDEKYDNRQVLTIGLVIVLCGSLLLFALYPLTLVIEVLRGHFFWLFIFFFSSNLHTVMSQYLKGTGDVKFFTVCGVISTAVTLGLNILFLVVLDMGIVGYMAAYAITHIVIVGVICVKINVIKSITNPFKIEKSTYQEILKYTCPMIPNSLSWWINNSLDKYMITWIISTAAMGVYSVAYKIPSIITIFVTLFMSAFQISAVENFGSDESKQFFGRVYKSFSSFCLIVSSALILGAELIAKILYQKDFFAAWPMSCVLIFSVVFHSMSGCLGTVYTSAKRTKFLFYSTAIGALINIVLNFILIHKMGIMGAAVATLISNVCVWVFRLISARKMLNFPINMLTDILSYVFITVEIILVVTDNLYAFLFAVLAFVVVCVINIMQFVKSGMLSSLKLAIAKKPKTEEGTQD